MTKPLWECSDCGDIMPAGFGEDDHFNCNHPTETRNGETYNDYLEGHDPSPQEQGGSYSQPLTYELWLEIPE